MPQLWQGFIRCAKIIAPSSFGAILQLPREQIRELVSKQPDLRDGLKEYVTKSEWLSLLVLLSGKLGCGVRGRFPSVFARLLRVMSLTVRHTVPLSPSRAQRL